jgi:DNA-directed RNA polymerase subunit L
MEIKVIEEKKGRMIFELNGVSHTICNLLKKELWSNKHIKNVGYTIKHPLVGKPEFTVETDGEDSKKIITSACQKLTKDLEKFGDEFKTEVK